MKRIATGLLVFVFCMVSGFAFAADKSESASRDKARDIEYLLDLTITDAFVESYVNGFTRIFAEQAASGEDPGNKEEIAAVMKTVEEVVIKEFPELKKQFVPVYDECFTHEEIKRLIAFYKEPVGRKLIQNMPVLTEKGMELGKEWGVSLSPKIDQALARKGIY